MKKKFIFISVLLFLVLSSLLCADSQSENLEDLITKEQFEEFCHYYYRNPKPENALKFLKVVVKGDLFRRYKFRRKDIEFMAHYLAKACRNKQEIIDFCITRFEFENHWNRLLLLRILEYIGGEEEKEFFRTKLRRARFINEASAIRYGLNRYYPAEFFSIDDPIEKHKHLGYLANNFYLTGNNKILDKMIDFALKDDPNITPIMVETELNNMVKSNEDCFSYCKETYDKSEGAKKAFLKNIIFEFVGEVSIEQRCKEADDKPLEEAKAWAMGFCAVLHERNHSRHNYLSPRKMQPEYIKKLKELLEKWWGIKSREDLFDAIEGLRLRGKDRYYQAIRKSFNKWDDSHFENFLERYKEDEENRQRVNLIWKTRDQLKEKGIVSYDMARIVSLCRSGYAIGYITEEEAWGLIIPAALKSQKTFDSWKDMGQNYILGRIFTFAGENWNKQYYYTALQRLVDSKSSPWNKYPWDMEVDPNDFKDNVPERLLHGLEK